MRQTVEPPATLAGEASGQQHRFDAEHAYFFAIAAAIALAFAIRTAHILQAPFPLNDGGLFYAMTRDIQQANFGLPEVTSYNAASFPFTYSPLGLYIAGLLDNLTPFSLFDLFRLLPLIYTTLSVGAFFLLARRILPSATAVVAATFAFAIVPRSFIWLLMGGGVTRGLGMLLALLALHEVHRTFTTYRMRYAFSAALLSGLTVLAHLETGWFLAFSIAIFFLWFGKERHSVISSVVIAGGTLLVTSPWLIAVVQRHGTEPFLAANSSGGSVFSGGAITDYALTSLARLVSTSEPFFPLIAMLGAVGLLCAVRHKLTVLAVWWAAIILLDVRAYPTFTTIPVAMLAGMAVSDIVIPMLDRAHSEFGMVAASGSNGHGAVDANGNGNGNGAVSRAARFHLPAYVSLPGWQTMVILLFLLTYAAVGAMIRRPGLGGEGEYLTPLSSGERTAMHWIAEETPPSSAFLVMPRGPWQVDKESEWFPVLAARPSIATVQGTEWSPDGGFDAAIAAFDGAWDCGYQSSECLATWAQTNGKSFTHIYIPDNGAFQCCGTLLDSLSDDPDYLKIYDGAGGTIFALVGTLPANAAPSSSS
jgi:hypothetical protein